MILSEAQNHELRTANHTELKKLFYNFVNGKILGVTGTKIMLKNIHHLVECSRRSWRVTEKVI
jgi:hypothetical protein